MITSYPSSGFVLFKIKSSLSVEKFFLDKARLLQVAAIATYSFFLFTLFGRQTLLPDIRAGKVNSQVSWLNLDFIELYVLAFI